MFTPNVRERITFCPKCHVYGAKMDLRDVDRVVVVTINGQRRTIRKKYLVKCGECGWVERTIRDANK